MSLCFIAKYSRCTVINCFWLAGNLILMQVCSYFHKRAFPQLKYCPEWAISIVVLTHAPANFRECCATTHVVVPGRNWTLFRCIFDRITSEVMPLQVGLICVVNPWILDMFTQCIWAPPLTEVLRSCTLNMVMHNEMNSTEAQNLRRKLDDKCLCLSYVFGSVLACAKSAHVFQKLVTNV